MARLHSLMLKRSGARKTRKVESALFGSFTPYSASAPPRSASARAKQAPPAARPAPLD